ncbi:helix-turn-helix transcriptional regulator [Comamonas humi]
MCTNPNVPIDDVSGLRARWRLGSGIPDERLLDAVRALLASRADAPPALAEVAQSLLLSPRTLRRRLFELNVRFCDLMAQARGQQACRYLLNTSWSLERIAEEVGYSDAANLRHAVKRWTGQSPQSFRQSGGALVSCM